MSERPQTIVVRAHTSLCMQGFEGRGYSPSFVQQFADVLHEIQAGATITLSTSPDRICHACPHGQTSGCRLHNRPNETHIAEQDTRVLLALGLSEGDVITWNELVERIAQRVLPTDLDALCGDCPWLPMGMCKRAIGALRGR